MQTEKKIIALGVGRAGCQAVASILGQKIEGVGFAAMRFRAKPDILNLFDVPLKFNLQNKDECKKIIDENFRNADIIFVIGNSPLAPCVAKAAKDSGILTIGILLSYYKDLEVMLKDASDALIPLGGRAWLVHNVVESISDIITKSGFVNLDIDDVKNTLRDVGTAYFGIGRIAGEYRAKVAALRAADVFPIKDAKRILINITTGTEISLGEMSEVADSIEKIAAPYAQVIWGHVIDESMGSDFQVTLIAGLDDKNNSYSEGSFLMEHSNEEALLKEVSGKVNEFNSHVQRTGEKFNVFEILDVETRETKFCRFLCELLSPSGSHNQGIFFLRPFVKQVLGLEIPDNELDENAGVLTEYTTENGRRIDIVILTSSGQFIPIEVKIYAWDLERQCKDYYDEAKRHHKDAKVFYLTLYGHAPSSESSCGVPVKCISFEKIHEWISYCVGQPEIINNAPIREVLLQFAATVKKITGQTEDKLKMEIAKFITSSQDNMKAAVSILSVSEEILEKMRVSFFKAVEREMQANGKESIKGNGELYYGDDDNKNAKYFSAGLFYAQEGEYDKEKPGVRLDIEKGWAYIGIFTPEDGMWSKWHCCALDNGKNPNFKEPNDALRELCEPEVMKKFAEKCTKKINEYLEKLKDNA